MAVSSIDEIHSRSTGFLHPTIAYTKRKINSPSRPASVAHTISVTSVRVMSCFSTANCFSVLGSTVNRQSIGRMGKSSYSHSV